MLLNKAGGCVASRLTKDWQRVNKKKQESDYSL